MSARIARAFFTFLVRPPDIPKRNSRKSACSSFNSFCKSSGLFFLTSTGFICNYLMPCDHERFNGQFGTGLAQSFPRNGVGHTIDFHYHRPRLHLNDETERVAFTFTHRELCAFFGLRTVRKYSYPCAAGLAKKT